MCVAEFFPEKSILHQFIFHLPINLSVFQNYFLIEILCFAYKKIGITDIFSINNNFLYVNIIDIFKSLV